MSDATSDDPPDSTVRALAALAVIIVTAGVLIIWVLVTVLGYDAGDAPATLSAIFSGLALAGVIVAIWLQRQELQAQREELRLTRGEIAGQREELRQQNATLTQQRFENSFFQVLGFWRSAVATMTARYQDRTATGVEAFRHAEGQFFGTLAAMVRPLNEPANVPEMRRRMQSLYVALFHDATADFSSYFHTLERLIRLIEESPVQEKQLYVDIVAAQLGTSELFALYLHASVDDPTRRVARWLSHARLPSRLTRSDEFALYWRIVDEAIAAQQHVDTTERRDTLNQ